MITPEEKELEKQYLLKVVDILNDEINNSTKKEICLRKPLSFFM